MASLFKIYYRLSIKCAILSWTFDYYAFFNKKHIISYWQIFQVKKTLEKILSFLDKKVPKSSAEPEPAFGSVPFREFRFCAFRSVPVLQNLKFRSGNLTLV